MNEGSIRSEIGTACDFLVRESLEVGSHGNISARLGKNRFLIKPSGMRYSDIVDEEYVEVTFNPETRCCDWAATSLRPSVDTYEHAMIYERHPEIKAVVHSHSTYATVFAMWGGDIQVYSTEHADFFGRRIRCIDDARVGWGEKVDLSVGERAVLLRGHGAVIVSEKGPVHAAELAVALEEIACKTFLLFQMPRIRPISPLPNDVVDAFHTRYNGGYGQR